MLDVKCVFNECDVNGPLFHFYSDLCKLYLLCEAHLVFFVYHIKIMKKMFFFYFILPNSARKKILCRYVHRIFT